MRVVLSVYRNGRVKSKASATATAPLPSVSTAATNLQASPQGDKTLDDSVILVGPTSDCSMKSASTCASADKSPVVIVLDSSCCSDTDVQICFPPQLDVSPPRHCCVMHVVALTCSSLAETLAVDAELPAEVLRHVHDERLKHACH